MRTKTHLIFWTALVSGVVLVGVLAGCSSQPKLTSDFQLTATANAEYNAAPNANNSTASEPSLIPKSATESLIAKASLAVVGIETKVACGTGFFINDKGWIATAAHVVEGYPDVPVRPYRLDIKSNAKVIYRNEKLDIAFLDSGIESPNFLPLYTLGTVGAGHDVSAIGFPKCDLLGTEEPNVTKGSISSIRSDDPSTSLYIHDSKLLKGNSGGPLISLSNGSVVGMNIFGIQGELDTLFFALTSQTINDIYAIAQRDPRSKESSTTKVIPTTRKPTTATPTARPRAALATLTPTPRTPRTTVKPTVKPRVVVVTATPRPKPTVKPTPKPTATPIPPCPPTTEDSGFTIGSTQFEVIAAQGNPQSITGSGGQPTKFFYGNSYVDFDYSTDLVRGWNNFDGNLKLRGVTNTPMPTATPELALPKPPDQTYNRRVIDSEGIEQLEIYWDVVPGAVHYQLYLEFRDYPDNNSYIDVIGDDYVDGSTVAVTIPKSAYPDPSAPAVNLMYAVVGAFNEQSRGLSYWQSSICMSLYSCFGIVVTKTTWSNPNVLPATPTPIPTPTPVVLLPPPGNVVVDPNFIFEKPSPDGYGVVNERWGVVYFDRVEGAVRYLFRNCDTRDTWRLESGFYPARIEYGILHADYYNVQSLKVAGVDSSGQTGQWTECFDLFR